jgi:hypothetical protein
MVLNFAPLDWPCWYSTSLKDGALRERGFQGLCAKVVFFLCVSVTILQSQFVGIIGAVTSVLKQIPRSKSYLVLLASISVYSCFWTMVWKQVKPASG